MRVCWNWQTGTFEGRVLYDVRVQVPSLALMKKTCLMQVFFGIWKYFLKGELIMETQYYKITNINGDYAFLVRTDIDSTDEIMVALALLPYVTDLLK